MKKRIQTVVALSVLLLSLISPIILAEEPDTTDDESPTTTGNSGGYGGPTAKQIAEAIYVEKDRLEGGDSDKIKDEKSETFKGKSKAELKAEAADLTEELATGPPNTFKAIINGAEKIIDVRDVPLDQLAANYVNNENISSSYETALDIGLGTLDFFGVDTSVLTLKDMPKIIKCGVISAPTLLNVLKNTHECITQTVQVKLEKQLAERFSNTKREEARETAVRVTHDFQSELRSNKTLFQFDMELFK